MAMEGSFEREKHIAFFAHAYRSSWKNPSADAMKMTVLYFIVSALDLLGALSSFVDRKTLIDWIYSQQVTVPPDSGIQYIDLWMNAGFRVGPCLGTRGGPAGKYDYGTLASTYCALCMLLILGDDLQRVEKKAIIKALPFMQQKNGCFVSHPEGIECDMRFLFCACAISYILNDWSGVDIEKATSFILSSQTYEGGIAMTPSQEAHAGSTYCACSSLFLMNSLNKLQRRERLEEWMLERQGQGYQGRVNKPLDTCYGFWVGGSAQVLGTCHSGIINYFERKDNFEFLFALQGRKGGFGKYTSDEVDLVHSYYGLCALSLLG